MRNTRSIYKLLGNWTALTLLAILLGATSVQSAASPNRAALVVVHGNGQTIKRCVEFSESQITGLDLLTRAGVDLNVDASNAIGVAVCRIDQEGCTYPTQSCFCQCQGSPCIYWAYWHLTGGTWKYSSTGASISVIHNGDMDGWVWGIGTVSGATPPPAVAFDQICVPSTATVTRTSTATNPTTTNTSVPSTNTPLRSTATALPTNTPGLSSVTPSQIGVASASPSRTLTPVNVRPSNTLVALSNPSLTPVGRAVQSPVAIAISTQTPKPTVLAVVVPTQIPVTETPPEESTEEPPVEPASDRSSTFGGVLRWGGIVLLGGVFCAATLVVFGLTIVALKRLM